MGWLQIRSDNAFFGYNKPGTKSSRTETSKDRKTELEIEREKRLDAEAELAALKGGLARSEATISDETKSIYSRWEEDEPKTKVPDKTENAMEFSYSDWVEKRQKKSDVRLGLTVTITMLFVVGIVLTCVTEAMN